MMKKIILLIFLFVTGVISAQVGQTPFINTSLDVITSTESIGMGESFVANSNNVKSFFENPAALFDSRNASFFYDYRYQGYSDFYKDSYNSSFGFTTRTGVGSFGISFNKYSSGALVFGEGDSRTVATDNNKTIILAYSQRVFYGLSFGISGKIFNRDQNQSGPEQSEVHSNTAFLCDLGLLYNFNSFIYSENVEDNLMLGVSIQNFGTDYREDNTLFGGTFYRRLPRYFRAGFAYELNLVLGRAARANVDLLFTGEYKKLINPLVTEKAMVDYWGIGAEATFLNIISLRIGGLRTPENVVQFERNKFNLRYGVGINIHVGFLGTGKPLKIKFDYSFIPLNQAETINTKSHLYSFGVTLGYGF